MKKVIKKRIESFNIAAATKTSINFNPFRKKSDFIAVFKSNGVILRSLLWNGCTREH